jgi:molybdenum cofactor biosynthesis enzyme MoaA
MDVTLTLKCNNNCTFCPRKDYLKIIACGSLKEIYQDTTETRRRANKIILSGGEPTVFKELWSTLDLCRQKGFREVGIITNGRRLKDMDFAMRLTQAGIKDFAISLYSYNEKIHDRITRKPGSASQTIAGILNTLRLCQRYNMSLRINIVLNYWNVLDIPTTLQRLFLLGARNFTIAEQIIVDKKSKHLSLQEVKNFLSSVRKINLEGARLVLRGFPLCFLSNHQILSRKGFILREKDPLIILEEQEVDSLVKEEEKKGRYFSKFKKLFTRIDRCHSCIAKNTCLGVQKAYLKK